MDLFVENALWANAAGHVHVFKMYPQWMDGASDTQLAKIVADLNRRGIAIALETPSLTQTQTCGQGVEGFSNASPIHTLRWMNRIRSAGGAVRYIAMDEPFNYGSAYAGPNACQWSAEKVAQDVFAYIEEIKYEFPDVVIGDIETDHIVSVDDMKRFLDAYRAVAGENLPFLFWDVIWGQQGWPERARAMESYARETGIKFGMIYNADSADDQAYVKRTEEHMVTYETTADGRPDIVLFQSWHPYPKHVLPETDPTAFTYVINRYFRTRTSLSLDLNPASVEGSWEVTGLLTEVTDAPVKGAPIELSVAALDGPGQIAHYTLTGTVPANASNAQVGFRVNMEGADPGASNFSLYEVSYREENEITQRVPNGDFSDSLNGWSFFTLDTVQVGPVDQGPGKMVRVTSSPTQSASINSAGFAVAPGATYALDFEARVSPDSEGGYFSIFFLGAEGEVLRGRIPLVPATLEYSGITDGDGRFSFNLTGVSPGRVQVDADYPGDETRWPAYRRISR